MTDFPIITPRLALRFLTEDDYPVLQEMLSDPVIMEAWGGTSTKSEIRFWLDNQYDRYRLFGFGEMAVVLRSTGLMVGQAGLIMQRFNDRMELEIAYMLRRRFWGHGFATEAARGCLRYAFERLGASRVGCCIKTTNQRSLAVARRLGLRLESRGDMTIHDVKIPHYLFVSERPAVLVVDYDNEWPGLFLKLREFLAPLLSELNLRLEHVGGTAIHGMAAQPVIDAVLFSPDGPLPRPRLDNALSALGFEPSDESPDLWEKTSRLRFLHRLILCAPEKANAICRDRDELRRKPEAIKRLSAIKHQAAEKYPDDPQEYDKAKTL